MYLSRKILLQKCVLLLSIASPFAKANFIIDPAGGVSVGFASNAEDDGVTRNLGGTFNFYGTPITKIGVSSDGYLGMGSVSGLFADRDLAVLEDASGGPIIAGFYDHTVFGPGTSVTEQDNASYYAITYQNLYGFDSVIAGFTTDYQIVLFSENITLGGFDFQSGDIAISYGRLASAIQGTFTVGVAESTSNFTGTTLVIDGELMDTSTLPTGNQFFLYRPHEMPIISAIRASGLVSGSEGTRVGYEVSIESTTTSSTATTPEPGSLALVGLTLLAPVFLRRKRR
jgi:hypothetical protein